MELKRAATEPYFVAGTPRRALPSRSRPRRRASPLSGQPLVRIGVISLAYLTGLGALASRTGVWGDEGFTAMMVQRPWRGMGADLSHIDVNMALYYALEKAAVAVVGDGPTGLRFVSMLSVVAAGLLLPWLADEVGIRHRWWPTAMLWLNPAGITLGLTARPYALLMLGTCAGLLALLRAERTNRPADWAWWGLVAGCALYVHLLAAFVALAGLVWALARLVLQPDPEGSVADRGHPVRARLLACRTMLVGAGVVTLLSVPGVMMAAPQDTLAWIGAPAPIAMARAVASGLGGAIAAPVVALTAGVGLLATRRHLRCLDDVAMPGGITLLLAACFLLLLPIQSLFVNEYLTVLLVPITMLATQGVESLPRRRLVALVVAVLLAGGTAFQAARDTLSFDASDWGGLVGQLEATIRPGEAIGFSNTFYRSVVEYYMQRQGAVAMERAAPVLPSAPWYSMSAYQLDRTKRLGLQVTVAGLVAPAPEVPAVWLLSPPDDELTDAATRSLLAAGYRQTAELTAEGAQALRFSR